jgi:hypothetical protein
VSVIAGVVTTEMRVGKTDSSVSEGGGLGGAVSRGVA